MLNNFYWAMYGRVRHLRFACIGPLAGLKQLSQSFSGVHQPRNLSKLWLTSCYDTQP